MRREGLLLPHVFLLMICLQYVNSIQSDYDLSNSPSPMISKSSLPPGQLDLVLSHPPGQLFLSRGCQATELMLKCQANKVLIVESARFTHAIWNDNSDMNCSSLTKHSEVSEREVIRKLQR